MRILRYAKFAEELEAGVTPAPDPQITLDIASSTIDTPTDSQLAWEGGIGRGSHTHRPGYYSVGGNVAVSVDVHTVAWFLRWALGGYAFTFEGGTGDLNLHEMWGSQETVLPPFTTFLGKDIFEHVVRGCMASQFQLAVSDGYAQATIDILGGRDQKGTLDLTVLDQLPLAAPLTFPDLRLWVGGTDPADERSAKITDLTLTVNNNGEVPAARGIGSRFTRRDIPAGQRDVTVEFTTFYDSTEHIERLWGAAEGPSDEGSTELPLRIAGGSGDDGALTVDIPRSVFNSVQTQPSGRSRIDQQVTASCYLDTVTLEDTTEVETDIYVRVENSLDELGPEGS